jgi:hypothetical protein
MKHNPQQTYVQQVLDAYTAAHGTRKRARPEDRLLAENLFRQAVPIQQLQTAFLLATARRTLRDPNLAPLEPIASLHYFLPVLDEVQRSNLDPRYIDYVKTRLRQHAEEHRST